MGWAGKGRTGPLKWPENGTIFRRGPNKIEAWRRRIRAVADGMKKIFSGGRLATGPGYQESGKGAVDQKKKSGEGLKGRRQLAGPGQWPNYLNPEITYHRLALTRIRQGDQQQKQHDGHGQNE